MPKQQQIRRVANRARRQLTGRVPVAAAISDGVFTARVARHRDRIASVTADQRALLDRIAEQGFAVTSLSALDLPGLADLADELADASDALSRLTGPADVSTLRLPRTELLERVALWQWGVSEPVLDLVEAHLGLPARYLGADLRRERADGRCTGVRQWHRDIEDHSMIKVIVWLDAVGVDGGPLQYVERGRTQETARALRSVSGFVDDQRMEQAAPRECWQAVTGPRGTAIMGDLTTIFHRAQPPTGADRLSATFPWSTRRPIVRLPVEPFTAEERAIVRRGLTTRQLACLPEGTR